MNGGNRRAEAARKASEAARRARESWTPEQVAAVEARRAETRRRQAEERLAMLRVLNPQAAADAERRLARREPKPEQPRVAPPPKPDALSPEQRRVYDSMIRRGCQHDEALYQARKLRR